VLLALVTIWPAVLTCGARDVLGTTIAYALLSLYSRAEPAAIAGGAATGGDGAKRMLVDLCQMDASVRRLACAAAEIVCARGRLRVAVSCGARARQRHCADHTLSPLVSV
jgi:hypothetical protein